MKGYIIDRMCSQPEDISACGVENDAARERLFQIPDRIHDVWENSPKFITSESGERLINPEWQKGADAIRADIKEICEALDSVDLIRLFEQTTIFANR